MGLWDGLSLPCVSPASRSFWLVVRLRVLVASWSTCGVRLIDTPRNLIDTPLHLTDAIPCQDSRAASAECTFPRLLHPSYHPSPLHGTRYARCRIGGQHLGPEPFRLPCHLLTCHGFHTVIEDTKASQRKVSVLIHTFQRHGRQAKYTTE